MKNDKNDLDNSGFLESMLSLQIMPKPFGFTWSMDQMKDFLKKVGYKIIRREGLDGETYYIAVKEDNSEFPTNNNGNILETFIKEVQEILLDWLINLKKNGK